MSCMIPRSQKHQGSDGVLCTVAPSRSQFEFDGAYRFSELIGQNAFPWNEEQSLKGKEWGQDYKSEASLTVKET